MNSAVFLDRDGVLNKNVFYPDTGEYESPRTPEDFELHRGAIEALTLLIKAQYRLFLVSNQPNFAKGKSTLDELRMTHEKLERALAASNISFDAFYYCYHHPDSRKPGFGGPCECRKPSPYFLRKAEREYGIDLEQSWMIGDRVSDIACGASAGVRTIRILPDYPCEGVRADIPQPDCFAKDMFEAVGLILSASRTSGSRGLTQIASDACRAS